jgi:hypothetical protein
MHDISPKLKVKYGLFGDPPPYCVRKWIRGVKANIAAGQFPEDAGRRAARAAFPESDRIAYSEAAEGVFTLWDEISERTGSGGRQEARETSCCRSPSRSPTLVAPLDRDFVRTGQFRFHGR